MDNLELLNYATRHKEPYIEEAYAKEKIIIAKAGKPNSLMIANQHLAERITAFQAAQQA